jgi:adenosine 3'-phospho 5'-phosphosulfate transporter B2
MRTACCAPPLLPCPCVSQTIRDVNAISHNDAGAELFILCTNFLLYVALVILTMLLQKIYFPESLPSEDDAEEILIDLEEEDDIGTSMDSEKGGRTEEPLKAQDLTSSSGAPPPSSSSSSSSGDSEDAGGMKRSSSSSHFLTEVLDFNVVNQEQMTKKQVLTRLLTVAIGLNLSFLGAGILQERMLTQPYNGEYFTSSYGLVFLNRLGGFIISALLFYFTKPSPTNAIVYEFSYPSVSNMLSSWCQYEALKYVSFPTQMLFKCFKLVPIMVMGKFLGNKSYPAYDYAVAVMIGFGIATFMVSTEDMNFGMDSMGAPETWSGTLCGIMLLFFFLAFDSFTGQWQSRMFHRHEDLTPAHMMLMVNTFSLVFSFITLVHTKEFESFMLFVLRHSNMHAHVVAFSVCNTIGQIFIFQTIRSFGAVVFAIVMNTRIILSILASCAIYSHSVSSQGFFGLFIVFASVGYRIQRKTAGQKIVRWRATTEVGEEWFHEVHEHIDGM